jgi:hypothetical protein
MKNLSKTARDWYQTLSEVTKKSGEIIVREQVDNRCFTLQLDYASLDDCEDIVMDVLYYNDSGHSHIERTPPLSYVEKPVSIVMFWDTDGLDDATKEFLRSKIDNRQAE